ncbi:MAG: PorV/PorQ family protein [candidate division WOR-3 bacterium]
MTRMTNTQRPMTKKILAVAFAWLLVASVGLAAFSKVGTTGAAFLKIGVGRATAMGEAFTAIADDASACYFNPAGLAHVGRQVQFNHVDWIADINHDHLAVVLPMTSFGTMTFAITALTMGDIEQTTIDNPGTKAREDEGTGLFFGAADFCVAATYSRVITDKLSFGFTAKGVQQSIWDMAASALGVDLGLFYNTGFRSLRIGATVANFGTQLAFSGRQLQYGITWPDSGPPSLPGTYRTDAMPLPTTFRFGIAYDLVDVSPSKLTAAIDLTHPSDINETVNIGLEYGYNELFALRGGYILNVDREYAKNVGELSGLTAGLGVRTEPAKGLKLGLDYTFRYLKYLKPTHRVQLTVGF